MFELVTYKDHDEPKGQQVIIVHAEVVTLHPNPSRVKGQAEHNKMWLSMKFFPCFPFLKTKNRPNFQTTTNSTGEIASMLVSQGLCLEPSTAGRLDPSPLLPLLPPPPPPARPPKPGPSHGLLHETQQRGDAVFLTLLLINCLQAAACK